MAIKNYRNVQTEEERVSEVWIQLESHPGQSLFFQWEAIPSNGQTNARGYNIW